MSCRNPKLVPIKEIIPGINRVAIITNQKMGNIPGGYVRSVEEAAQSYGVSVTAMEVRDDVEIERTIVGLQQANLGLIFPPDSFISAHRAPIIELAARLRLPAIYFARS